jgi:hypothetical protein
VSPRQLKEVTSRDLLGLKKTAKELNRRSYLQPGFDPNTFRNLSVFISFIQRNEQDGHANF